jgi:hypothetical protein
MSDIEIWKDIEGYEGIYQISNFGRVKSLKRITTGKNGGKYKSIEKIMIPEILNGGHLRISLFKNGYKRHLVHRLVAIAFIPNPDNLPFINHINNNPSHNFLENLEWCTPKQNSAHMVKHDRQAKGEKNGDSKLKDGDIKWIKANYVRGNKNFDMNNIAKKFNVHPSTISLIISNKTWKHIP